MVVLDRGLGDGARLLRHLEPSDQLEAVGVTAAQLQSRTLPWPDACIDDVVAVLLMVQQHPHTVAALERIVGLLGGVPLVVVADGDADFHMEILTAGVSEVVDRSDLDGAAVERAVASASARRRSSGPDAPHPSIDALTGLVNRVGLQVDLPMRLAAAAERHESVVVMYADLDRFKSVNDSFGHAAGDAVIVEAADRLQRSVRSSDLVVRLGGDEFVIVLDGPRVHAVAEQVSHRILRAFSGPIELADHDVVVGISLGMATSVPGDTPAGIVARADRALYLAKRRGRGRIAHYDDDLERSVEQLQSAATLLRQALERDRLGLAVQPVVDGAAGSLIGHSYRATWGVIASADLTAAGVAPAGEAPDGPPSARRSSGDGRRPVVSPEHVASQAGLAADLLRWTAMQLLADHARPEPVNGPARSFLHLPGSVVLTSPLRVLGPLFDRFGGDPGRVVALVDEECLTRHDDPPGLAELMRAGFRIGVRRFGSAHGALNLLERFPFDTVWVDSHVIDGIAGDATRRAKLRAVTAMTRALGQRVVVDEPFRAVDDDALRSFGDVAVARRSLDLGRYESALVRPMGADGATLRT